MSIEADAPAGGSTPPVALLSSGLVIGGCAAEQAFEGLPDGGWWPPDDADEPDDLGEALGPVGLLRVHARACSQDLARKLAAIHDIGRRYGPRRAEFAADEVGAALGWSRTMAANWLRLAVEIIDRLPALHQALRTGALDEVKVRTIAEQTRPMPDDLASEVTAHVLTSAAGITQATLIDLIGSTAVGLDPDWAARRELAARRRVRMVGVGNPTGTTDVAVRDLHPAHGAQVMARVDALAVLVRNAASIRGIRAGIHPIRALISVRLQDGSCAGLDDDALVDELVEHLPAWLHDHGLDPESDGPDPGGGPTGPDPSGPTDPGGPTGSGSGETVARRHGGVRTGTVEVRLRLSTALGLDDLPGQLPTWGAITAPAARDLLARARTAGTPSEWRLALIDDDGHLEHLLLIRPDPHPRPAGPRRHRSRRGRTRGRTIVELAAATTTLRALDPAAHPDWAPLIERAQNRLAALSDHDHCGDHPATTDAEAHRRRPGRELDRWVRVRDRHCIGVLCTRAAHSADLDHTRGRSDHGPTLAANLGSACRHCHRLKHRGGWRLHQPAPGHFVWRTLLGERFVVAPRPILPAAPRPAPPAAGDRPRAVHDVGPPWPEHHPPWIEQLPRPAMSSDVPRPPSGVASRRHPDEDPDEPPF